MEQEPKKHKGFFAKNPELRKLKNYCKKVNNIEIDMHISSLQEIGKLYYAHLQKGPEHVQTANFLSYAIIPDPNVITVSYIFKALKFNEQFYKRYETLIYATSSFRERAYRQARKQAKEAEQTESVLNKKKQAASAGSIAISMNDDSLPKYTKADIISSIKSGKDKGTCLMPYGPKEKCATSGDNELSLIDPCSLPYKDWKYVKGIVYRNNDKDEDEIEIIIDIPNVPEFIDSKKKLFIIIFNEEDNSINKNNDNLQNQANWTKLETNCGDDEGGYLLISAKTDSGLVKDGSKWDIVLLEGDS